MVVVGGLCCIGLCRLCVEFVIVGVRDVGGGVCSMGCDVGRVGAGLGVGRCFGPVWRVLWCSCSVVCFLCSLLCGCFLVVPAPTIVCCVI